VLLTLNKRFEFLDDSLEGKDYLMGKQFTVADAYLFTVLRWTGFLKIDLSKWQALSAYIARVKQRPKVQEALKSEGLN
jgi:glutathione S-transferase